MNSRTVRYFSFVRKLYFSDQFNNQSYCCSRRNLTSTTDSISFCWNVIPKKILQRLPMSSSKDNAINKTAFFSTNFSAKIENKAAANDDSSVKAVKAHDDDDRILILSAHSSQAAILRYLPGDERLQLKIILRNGKIFNFDRSVTDSVESFVGRIGTNLSKKLKAWDEKVTFLLSSKTDNGEWIEVPIDNMGMSTECLLGDVVTGLKKLNIQISEDIYEVAINPPEIYGIKFLKQLVVGFPIVPYKIEASNNFHREHSKYKWEFANAEEVELKSDKKRRKSSEKNQENSIWKDTGCNSFLYVPTANLVNTKLRFTCTPSDGYCFGLQFCTELSGKVETSDVQNPLFMERLNRMEESNISDPNFLRVVSYNCLADTYATEEWFVSSPKGSLSADFRLPYLCKELEAYQADVFCLQEIDEKYYEGIFSPFFEYALKHKGLFTSKVGNTKEGVATFYNAGKLDFLRNESVIIYEHMKMQPFWSKINSISPEFSTRLQERNTVLQVSIFKHKGLENTILVIANTHLYFHPDADHIRLLQTITCVDFIETTVEEIKKTFPQFQVVLLFCGDFNCTPPFSSYRFLTSGRIEEDDFDWTSHGTEKINPGIQQNHGLKLKNSHPGEELTNITTCFEGCIDYILYQPQHFEVLKTYPPPAKSVIASIIGVDETRKVSLPNFHSPSDHMPLIVDFSLLSSSNS